MANITYVPTSNTFIGKLEFNPGGVFPKFLADNIGNQIGFTPFGEPDTSCSRNEVINGTSEFPDSCTNRFGAATLFCLSVRELLISLKQMVNHDYSIDNILLNLNSLLGLNPSIPIPPNAIICCWRVLNPKLLRRPCGNLPAVDKQSCNYDIESELPLRLCEIDDSNRLHHLKKIAMINGLCSDKDDGYPYSGTGATYNKTKSDKVGVLEMICIQAKINQVIAKESINMTKVSELLQLPEVDIYRKFDPDNIPLRYRRRPRPPRVAATMVHGEGLHTSPTPVLY